MDRTCSRGARPIQTVAAAQFVGHVGRHAPSCLSPYNLFFKIPLPYNPREEERETHFSFYFISVRKFVNSIYFFLFPRAPGRNFLSWKFGNFEGGVHQLLEYLRRVLFLNCPPSIVVALLYSRRRKDECKEREIFG